MSSKNKFRNRPNAFSADVPAQEGLSNEPVEAVEEETAETVVDVPVEDKSSPEASESVVVEEEKEAAEPEVEASTEETIVKVVEEETAETAPVESDGEVEDVSAPVAEDVLPEDEPTLTQPVETPVFVKPQANPNEMHPVAKAFIGQVGSYIYNMRPTLPVEPEEAATQQFLLFKTLETCLTTESAEVFNAGLTGILNLMHEHKDGAFCPSHRMRYLDVIPEYRMESEEIAKFVILVETLMMLSDPEERKNIHKHWRFDTIETLLEPIYYLRFMTYVDRITGKHN